MKKVCKIRNVFSLIILLLSQFPTLAFAATGPFLPGTQLDPACLPTDVTCIVTTGSASTSPNGITIASSSPLTTSVSLYNLSGALYWNGSLLSTIGSSTNFVNATSTNFFATNLTATNAATTNLVATTATVSGNQSDSGTLSVTGTTSLATTTVNGSLTTNGASTLNGTTTIANAVIGNIASLLSGAISHTFTTGGNTATSTVNGVISTSSIISSATASSSTNFFNVLINGIASSIASIINSFSQSVTGNVLTSTVNGVVATTSVISSNGLASSVNTITSMVNGVATTTTIVNSNLLTYATSTSLLTTSINGVVATTSIALTTSLVSIVDFGADPTGTVASDAALANCVSSSLGSGKTCYAPAGRYKLNNQTFFDTGAQGSNGAASGIHLRGDGCNKTYFNYTGTSAPAFRLGTDTLSAVGTSTPRGDNFYSSIEGITFVGNVPGPVVQLGRDDMVDAINGASFNMCVNQNSKSTSAEGVRINALITSSATIISTLAASTTVGAWGSSWNVRGAAMSNFYGSASGGAVGITLTATPNQAVFGNTFHNIDMEVNLRDVVVDTSGGAAPNKNTFDGGQYDHGTVIGGLCAIDATAGSYTIFNNANLGGANDYCSNHTTGIQTNGASVNTYTNATFVNLGLNASTSILYLPNSANTSGFSATSNGNSVQLLAGTDGSGYITNYTIGKPIQNTVQTGGTHNFWIGPTQVMSIGTNIGIGTTTPTAQFSTTGTVRFSTFGAGTLQTDALGNLSVSSDERLKNIDAPFTRSLADIQKLNPISYHWNTLSGLDTGNSYSGFSAQNVQTAIPEAVGTSSNGFLTLQDRPILATVVNAIKDIGSISGTFKDSLVAWLGDVNNNLASIHAKKIQADQICAGSTCVTESQLQQLLQAQSGIGGISTSVLPTTSAQTTNLATSSDASNTSDILMASTTSALVTGTHIIVASSTPPEATSTF